MINYSNNGYDIISFGLVIILFLISQYYVISSFFKRKKITPQKVAILFILFFSILFFTSFFCDFFTYLIIEALIICSIMCLLFKSRIKYALILSCFCLFLYTGLRYFFASLFTLLLSYDVGHFSSITYFLSSFSMFALANIFNKYPILKNEGEYPIKYIFCLSITPIISLLIMNNMYLLATKFIQINSFFSLFTIILLFFLNFIIFKVFDFLIDDSNIKKQNALFEQQIKSYSTYITDYENSNKEAKKFQHDLKNQMLYIRKLVEIKESKKALMTIESLIDDNSCLNAGCICGNIVVDSIMKSKIALASNCNIIIKYHLEIPIVLPFKETDICILIGNALDNSIEACKQINGDKKIEVFIKYIHKNLILRIKNPYSGELDNMGIEFFVSSKYDKYNHGFGLKSISKIVDQNNGIVNIKTSNHIFDMKIILIGTP